MKIGLITPIKGENLGIGMSKYANVICEGLGKKQVRCISFSDKKLNGKIPKLLNGFFPLKAIKEFIKSIQEKVNVYHFICPELMYKPFGIFQFFVIKYLLRKKIILTAHDLMTLEESEGSNKTNWLIKPIILRLIQKSDIIIANSSQTREETIKSLKIDPKKIIVVDLGIQKKYQPLKKNSKRKIGYFSAFDVVKDPLYAVKCFAKLDKKFPKKFSFEMWGSGMETKKCEELAKKEKIKNIRFRGYLPEDKVVETYNSFDVYLMTSKYEGFGLNIGEAIACGIPTIVRENARITPELKKLCVIGKDEEDIANKIAKLSEDKKYRKEIIEKGLKEIKKFTWEKNFKGHFDVYRSLNEKVLQKNKTQNEKKF
jgi:glycosyltransferase involved in cell wall biosynthesis